MLGSNVLVTQAELIAQDAAGDLVEVKAWEFEVLLEDVDDASNGVNGAGCANGRAVDEVRFDNKFTCDCEGVPFKGANCERPEMTSSGAAGPTGAVLGVLLTLAVVALAAYHYRQHMIRMRAFDFEAGAPSRTCS
jgi:hypothetical protein